MRICLVYDCLYPHTVGGAERWYRNLAERLAAAGHEVTYVTLRQWTLGEDPGVQGVRVVAVGPRMELYANGKRRLLPPLVFGAGVLRHLLGRGRRYDVVHTASFPFFSLLAAGLARRRGRYRIVVDWHEVWTRQYWLEYAGNVTGRVGWLVQRRCAHIGDRAFCFARMHAKRLRELGFRGSVTVLEGEYAGPLSAVPGRPAERVVVFAGRHIPEKRVHSLIPAFSQARERIPDLQGELYGDGPDRASVLELIADEGLEEVVIAPGFVDGEIVDEAIGRALCLVLPSQREGYGLIVVEALAKGTPAIVAAGPDNAATELIEDGVNGFIAASAEPKDLASAIVRVYEAGEPMRASTRAWFERNAERLSLDRSVETILDSYERD